MNDDIKMIDFLDGSKVIGMREEFIMDMGPGQSAFDEEPEENVRYVIFVKKTVTQGNSYQTLSNDEYFSITLDTMYGWCGSGYTTASTGDIFIEYINSENIGPLTHVPVDKDLKLEKVMMDKSEEFWDLDICTNLFKVSYDGGDGYYPSGYADVNKEMFKKLPRAMSSRPRYIFYGNSGLGKTTLGMILGKSLSVYETDSNKDLPDKIWEDVVILSNKWNFTKEDVKDHLSSTDNVIYVGFEKGE